MDSAKTGVPDKTPRNREPVSGSRHSATSTGRVCGAFQRETGVRRETASAYLKAAGIAVRPSGGWGKFAPESKPANGPSEVSTDVGGDFAASPAVNASETPTPEQAKPANAHEVSTGSAEPGRSAVTSSACEPHRDFIELPLAKGRNARAIYQDLVDEHGFTGRYASVKRFVRLYTLVS